MSVYRPLNYLKWLLQREEDSDVRYTGMTRAYLQGKFRHVMFYYDLIKSGEIIRNITEDIAIEFCKQIDMLITSLKEIYEDNWDIFIYFNESSASSISENGQLNIELLVPIYFDEVEICNSRDESHTIKGLLVAPQFNFIYKEGKISIYPLTIRGARTNLSASEFSEGYLHSHLTVFDNSNIEEGLSKYHTFCTGVSEGTLGYIMQNFTERALTGETINQVEFSGFLFMLNSLVSWESLEGVPYAYINNLSDNEISEYRFSSLTRRGTSPPYKVSRFLIRHLLDSNKLRDLISGFSEFDFIIQDGRFKILNEDYVKNFMVDFTKEILIMNPDSVILLGSFLIYRSPSSNSATGFIYRYFDPLTINRYIRGDVASIPSNLVRIPGTKAFELAEYTYKGENNMSILGDPNSIYEENDSSIQTVESKMREVLGSMQGEPHIPEAFFDDFKNKLELLIFKLEIYVEKKIGSDSEELPF